MSYEFEHDESVADGFRRIALEQLDAAIEDLDVAMTDDPAAAVHDCRKRCKKLRGLVRLVRPAIGDDRSRRINDLARDGARELTALRDAAAIHESYERLIRSSPSGEHPPAVVEVGRILAARHEAVDAELRPDHSAVDRARVLLHELRDPIDDAAALIDDDWDSLGRGLGRNYGRARRAMRHADREPTGEHFHEWRKRTKYGWYHVRLLTPVWPAVLGAMGDELDRLSEALGDAHDMVVLQGWLTGDDPVVGRLREPETVLDVIDGRRRLIEQRALDLGHHVFAERPRSLVDRLGVNWRRWRTHGPPGPTGGLDVVVPPG